MDKKCFLIAPTLLERWKDIILEMDRRGIVIVTSVEPKYKVTNISVIKDFMPRVSKVLRRPALFFPSQPSLESFVISNKISHIITWSDPTHISSLIVFRLCKKLNLGFTLRGAQNIKAAIKFPFSLYVKPVLKNCAKLVTVAPPSTRLYTHFESSITSKALELGNGFDTSIFFYRDLERIFDGIYIGHFEERKGVLELINIIKDGVRLRNSFKFAFVGGGSLEQKLKLELAELVSLGNVVFYGWKNQYEVSCLLNRSKFLFLLSKSNMNDHNKLLGKLFSVPWSEQFGRSSIEAQACGVIPVVSNSGGLPFAVGVPGIQSALIFEENSNYSAQFISFIKNVSEAELAKISYNATANSRRFHLKNIVDQIIK